MRTWSLGPKQGTDDEGDRESEEVVDVKQEEEHEHASDVVNHFHNRRFIEQSAQCTAQPANSQQQHFLPAVKPSRSSKRELYFFFLRPYFPKRVNTA